MSPPLPPWWARALLRRLLPADEIATVLGDLDEGFVQRARERGGRAARRWYRREALAYVLRVGLPRGASSLGATEAASMTREIRIAARALRRRPAFSLVVVLTLAVGIGTNASVFGLVDAVLFRPLPVEDPANLIEVYGSSERDGNAGGMFQGFLSLSYPNFVDLREGASTLDGAFVHSQWSVSVAGDGEPERVEALYVSGSFFDVLGVSPLLGRGFRPDEDRQPGADALVVLRHGYWERRFGSDPAVVGRTLRVNGRPLEVVGIAPPGFRGPRTTQMPDLFIPVSMIVDVPPWGPLWQNRGLRLFNVGARIADGRGLSDVRAELSVLGRRLAELHPESNRDRGLQVLPLAEAKAGPNQRAFLGRTGLVLLSVAGLVLLVACMNVGNLLLARGLSRQVEFAIRTSVGATRRLLIRHLVTESALLFALGAGLGVGGSLLTLGALDGLRSPAFGGMTLDVGMDLRVLTFALASTLVCMLLFGLGPALRSALTPAGTLRRGGSGLSGGHWLRDGMIVGQVALSVVALTAAGLFLRSLDASMRIDPGVDLEGLGMLSVDPTAQGYEDDELRLFYRRLVEETEARAGVVSSALGSLRPLSAGPLRRATRIDEDPSDAGVGHLVRVESVSPGYFATLGITLEEGRLFDDGDRQGAPSVAVANGRLIELLWPGREALGQQLVLGLVDDPLEVVGTTATAKAASLTEDPQPVLYVPLDQIPTPAAHLFVRGRTASGLDEARAAVRTLDASLPVYGVTTGEGLLADALWTARATAWILTVFGLGALFLAAVGIYGVVAHSVRERTREMGLRIALGAGRGSVVASAVGRVMAAATVGAAIGLAAALLATGAVADLLVGVNPHDPGTLAGVTAGLLFVAAIAGFLPARRATRVDPMVVLRTE